MDVTTPGDYSAGDSAVRFHEPVVAIHQLGQPGGTHLIAFNGADDGIWWDGTDLVRLVAGDGTLPARGRTSIRRNCWSSRLPTSIASGLSRRTAPVHGICHLSNCSVLPSSSTSAATSTVAAILQALTTYTYDSGYGPNDYLAAISSAGEVSLYKGIDPDSLASWELIGVFYVGGTFTRRCTTKFGGDFAMLTQYGMVTMNSVMSPESDSVLNNALSQKIQYLISR